MKLTLSVEGRDGQLSYVEAEDATYQAAKARAEAQIPEGSKAITIRAREME